MKKVTFYALVALWLSGVKAYGQEQSAAAASLRMAQNSLLVKDYKETLDFYMGTLGFIKTADIRLGNERWVTIAPPGQKGAQLVLVEALTPADLQVVGKQAGDRTLIVLETIKFDEMYKRYKDKSVHFIAEPSSKPWDRQAEFTDLYGNHLVLLELRPLKQQSVAGIRASPKIG